MPTVSEAINHGRRAIAQLEPSILADLLNSYEQLWWHVERQIRALPDAPMERLRGESVTQFLIRRETWYRQLQASIDDQFVRFNHTALNTIVRGQSQAVGISAESTTLFRHAVGIQTPFVGRVNVNAFERWVSAVQPGSPIRGVIERYGPRMQEAIVTHITDGIGSGKGIGMIVKNITDEIGPDAVGGRLQTLARTEVLRAYRGSSRDAYDAMPDGLVIGYRWTASLSLRTCTACIAKHGTITRQYPMSQHVACRCVAIPLVSPEYVPPRELGQTGSEWFAKLPESKQRQILPTRAHFEAFQNGTPLSAMTGVKQSRMWGPSVFVRPASALPGGK